MPHFHICWSSSSELDWKRFETRTDAEICAKALVQPYETYAIVVLGDTCERCAQFESRKPAARLERLTD